MGTVRVGEEVVEGRAEGGGVRLLVRRAPVYLGGAPQGSGYLPPAQLYKTGHHLQSHCCNTNSAAP